MIKIAVVDPNPFIARQVGRLIRQSGHRSVICKNAAPHTALNEADDPDLVLVGRRRQDEFGWDRFNQWREAVPGLPALLYVLDDCSPGGMAGLGRIIDQALADVGRPATQDVPGGGAWPVPHERH